MKAIVSTRLGGPEVLQYIDVEEPTPGPNQVLLGIRAASINFADIKARKGTYHLAKAPPFIPDSDCAGVVMKVGRDVNSIKVGQRVIAFPLSGSYAEKAIADEQLTFPIPDTLSFNDAAALPIAGGAAMHMLAFAAKLQPGERVLVHGASGGVGSIAVQIARNLEAGFVAATSGRPSKYPFLKSLGVDHVFEIREKAYRKNVFAVSSGHGFDVILNCFGGSTVPEDLACLAAYGRLVLFGGLTGEPTHFSNDSIYNRNLQLIGFSFGHLRKTRPALVRPTIEKTIQFCASGKITCKIHRSMPLQDAGEGHLEIEERRVEGKIILTPV